MVNMTLVSLLRHMVLSRRNACLCTGSACLYGIPESTLRDRTLGLQPIPCSSDPLPRPGPKNFVFCHWRGAVCVSFQVQGRDWLRLLQERNCPFSHKPWKEKQFWTMSFRLLVQWFEEEMARHSCRKSCILPGRRPLLLRNLSTIFQTWGTSWKNVT